MYGLILLYHSTVQPHMFIGGMLDSPTHSALTSRSHTVPARAPDSSHELLDWLSAWQRERPVVATVATLAPARARLAVCLPPILLYSCT